MFERDELSGLVVEGDNWEMVVNSKSFPAAVQAAQHQVRVAQKALDDQLNAPGLIAALDEQLKAAKEKLPAAIKASDRDKIDAEILLLKRKLTDFGKQSKDPHLLIKLLEADLSAAKAELETKQDKLADFEKQHDANKSVKKDMALFKISQLIS